MKKGSKRKTAKTSKAIQPKKRGRSSKQTPEKIAALCKHIEEGLNRKSAAKLIGIGESTLYAWMAEDPELKERIKKADAGFEKQMLSVIVSHAYMPKNWQAAAWILERKFPHLYGKYRLHESDEDTDSVEGLVISIDIDVHTKRPLVVRPGATIEDVRKSLGLDEPDVAAKKSKTSK